MTWIKEQCPCPLQLAMLSLADPVSHIPFEHRCHAVPYFALLTVGAAIANYNTSRLAVDAICLNTYVHLAELLYGSTYPQLYLNFL